jgi:hypothetical protein
MYSSSFLLLVDPFFLPPFERKQGQPPYITMDIQHIDSAEH